MGEKPNVFRNCKCRLDRPLPALHPRSMNLRLRLPSTLAALVLAAAVGAASAADIPGRYRAFLDAPSGAALLDLLVEAVDAAGEGAPSPEVRALLLEQFAQDPPPRYRVDLDDAAELDGWTVAFACAEAFDARGRLPPAGPVVAICSRERDGEVYRFHLFNVRPADLPAIRAALAGP